MFKYVPNTGGKISRCTFAAMLLTVILAFTFSGVVQAQGFHGVIIAKQCTQDIRTCTGPSDCTDGNQCTADICDTTIPNTMSCRIRVIYTDELEDTITVRGSFDTVDPAGAATRVPATGSLPIIAVGGSTDCVVGPFVECMLFPDTGDGTGFVDFLQDTYVIQPGDPNPLPDRGTVTVADGCDGIPDTGCNSLDNDVVFTAQTVLVDGCDNPNEPTSTACDLEDGNECTTSGCDGAGTCNPIHQVVICDPDDDLCTTDFVCDTDTGLCPPPSDPRVCEPNADGVICDLCDPDTGECIAEDPVPDLCLPPTRFRVTKDFSDDNPSGVMVHISCDTGLPLTSHFEIFDAPGSHVTFIVEEFVPGTMECTITEAPIPGGYTGTYTAGLGDDGIADSISGGDTACVFSGVVGGHFTCEIFNKANPGTFTVYKDWVIENNGGDFVREKAKVRITCDHEILDDGYYSSKDENWHKQGLLGDGQYLSATVDTTEGPATCWADEKIHQSGVVSTDDCDDRLIFAGGSSECRFVNTVFFEGIPTLNQYGLALLALLMLGVGMIGFRRMV